MISEKLTNIMNGTTMPNMPAIAIPAIPTIPEIPSVGDITSNMKTHIQDLNTEAA